MPAGQAVERISHDQQQLARSAGLLEIGDTMRFSHQLLQEYFTAIGMRAALQRGELKQMELWPLERWWERTGWEEATVFMAGLESDNPVPLIDWLVDAQPAVLLQCLDASGCRLPTVEEINRLDLKNRWAPRVDPHHERWEEAPEARNPIALALGRFGLDGRKGIGLDDQGLPDIDWVEIPGGEFLYGENKEKRQIESFRIARYPVTNAQFQAFIDGGGYQEKRWWPGFAERIKSPREPTWGEPNRPRETVSWYEAVAFCHWLSAQRGEEIRLPSEEEWERAARGTDGREYPWGDGYREGHANINETWEHAKVGSHNLGETSPVGLYPLGVSSEGVLDLAGNVWEWCLNEYEKPGQIQSEGNAARVLRGGSWFLNPVRARASARLRRFPVDRSSLIGFRVVCSAPIR